MFESLLAKIARALDRAGIPYMVIGGQAVLLHGEPRLTRDIDITLGVDASDLERLLEVIREAGLVVGVQDVRKFARETNVVPSLDDASGIRVDFIFSFSEYERRAIERTVVFSMEDTSVRFAAVEDLIIHKLVAARPRDLEDVRGILLRNPNMDQVYLDTWLRSFSESLGRNLGKEYGDLRGVRSEI